MPYRETTKWLHAFLNWRGLEAPDQRELYLYRCTEDEFRELGQVLRNIPNFTEAQRHREVCGALVLGIAEWSRRERQIYHHWEWEPINQKFDLNLEPTPRGKIIERGLEGFWGRPIHRFEAGHRDFLGSLLSEGGLPLQVLRAQGNPLHSLFGRLLRRIDQAKAFGADMELYVRREVEASLLPQVFSSIGPVQLIAVMTKQLHSLVQIHALESKADPVGFLDEQDPRWRERFPIPLDQEMGAEFLNSLLKTASEEGRRRCRTERLTCTHTWRDVTTDRLESVVGIPIEINLPLEHVPATSRLEVEIFEGSQPRLRLGAAFADLSHAGYARLRLHSGERTINRYAPTRWLFLAVSAGGLQVGKIEIPASAIPLGEVPVGFARHDEAWRVCGHASFRVEDRDVIVVSPQDVSLESVEPKEAEVELQSTPFGLEAYRLQGQATLTLTGADRYRVRTRQESEANSGLMLAGDILGWPTSPLLCTLGTPRAAKVSTDGTVDTSVREVCIGGRRIEALAPHEFMGVHFASIRNDSGETLLRRKIGILPADFQIALTSGHRAGQGLIRITSAQRCLININDDQLQVHRTREEGATTLRVQATGEIPAEINMRVTPSLAYDPIEVRLPFPYVGCMALDCNGKLLANDLSVDDLLGARLMLYGTPGHLGFSLTLSLAGYPGGQLYDRWTYRIGQHPLQINLHGLREKFVDLLSIDTNIDSEVRLEVEGGPAPLRRRVRLFGAEIRQVGAEELRITPRYNPPNVEALPFTDVIEPRLMLLHDPSVPSIPVEPIRSEGVKTGGFRLPQEVERDGPWLVVPSPGSTVSFRPFFVPGRPDPEVDLEHVKSLQKAVQAFRPHFTESSFAGVIDAMSVNPRHGGWEFLSALYRNYGYLPLTTFEVWKALMQHQRALCMAMFKFEMDKTFVSRLERDFPLFFEMLPVQEFRSVTGDFHRFLLDQGVPDETTGIVLGRLLGNLEDTTVAYGEHLQQWLRTGVVDPRARQRMFLPALFEDVVRNRAEVERWPDYGAPILANWMSGQSGAPVGGLVPEVMHRKSVAYLPAFVAAVALGQVRVDELFDNPEEALFQFRRIRDFDTTWFRIAFNAALFSQL